MHHDHEHLVHLYENDGDLAATVARYLAGAVEAGGTAMMIAEPPHRRLVLSALERLGVDLDRVVVLDSTACIASFVQDGHVDRGRFEAIVGRHVREAAARGEAAAYGEMVAELWRGGLIGAALELEQVWNDLAEEVSFRLLCAYPADDAESASFADVCRAHSGLHECPFPAALDAPGRARRVVTGALRSWGHDHAVDRAAIVVTELATNAVAHAASDFTVSLARRRDRVRVAVTDASPAPPRPRVAIPSAPSGRGLLLVDGLADGWGTEVDVDGKVVWADLRT